MSAISDTIERQIDELSALKAIFGSDLRDLRKKRPNGGDVADRWTPIEVQICLKPMASTSQLNQEVFVQLDLYVKCGIKYPNVIPDEISLKNIKALSASVCQLLKNDLYELAKRMRGEVMIFAMAEHVRQFLHSHNKPPVKSFYDQMISHQTKLEIEKNLELEKEMESNRRKDEMRRRQLEEELQRKQMALLEESRLRRESRGNIDDVMTSEKTCDMNHEMVCITFDINGSERRVQRGKCLFHNVIKHSVDYLAFDLTSGQTYVITEWIIRLAKYKMNYLSDENSIDDITDRISQIETLFKANLQFNTNSNLIRYLSMHYSIKSDFITIDLLQEHINGYSFYSLGRVVRGEPLNCSLIRHYFKKILEVLNFLHKHNCPHGFLKETNIFIDNFTGEIKINGYYLEKQLYDLFNEVNSLDPNANISRLSITNSNRLKMKDIYDFGIIAIAVNDDWNFNDNIKVVKNKIIRFDQELRNFINKCIDTEENARWTPDLLLNHPFLLSQKSNNLNHKTSTNQPNLDICKQTDNEEPKDKTAQNKVILSSIVSSSISSRIMNEFEVIDELGKGGFGFVYKVKNILDGRCYALKKILINPSNHSLYEKIRREVNLLSRLNHENVVRYFTSWIETEDNPDNDISDQSSSAKTIDNVTQFSSKSDKKSKEEPEKDNDDSGSLSDSSSVEEVDFEAEEDIFGTSFLVTIPQKVPNTSSDDQYVVFERSDSNDNSDETKLNTKSINKSMNKTSNEDSSMCPTRSPRQYMFIQMELCEKSTLRDAIDSGLINDTHRKRRLFREMVEGLVHIHEQGMIHRDLKPGNIFLDVNDHVKIGDFGLAKEIYLIKEENGLPFIDNEEHSTLEVNKLRNLPSDRYTGRVGTPFYVAPELTVSADVNSNKIFYTQKVDIYSLGIIFFEMSYPFQTLMERTKVIMNLRKKERILPNDCTQYMTDVEIELLKSLLEHDFSLRPSSSELLNSECLPAPEMEEKEEQNVIRRAVQNSRTKLHKYMLNELFKKETSEIEDYVFDADDQQFGAFVRTNSDLYSFSAKQRVFKFVYSLLESLMQSHCAVSLPLPTLVPKHSVQRHDVNDVYYVIDNNGSIVSLPHDLRVPFARYIARNRISHFKRYSIEKVYRQRKVMGYHPKELWECAFDIVTPKSNHSSHVMPDAEVLTVLSQVVNQFPTLNTSKLTLKVNHMKLVKAILDYCDIPEESHNRIIRLIGECNSIKMTQNMMKDTSDPAFSVTSSLALKIHDQRKKILEKYLEESKVNCILQLIDLEQDSVKKLMSNIRTQMRKKSVRQQNALEMAKKALKELELILSFAEKLGNLSRFSLRISPAFVMSGTSSTIYSGFIFQLDREIKHKKSSQRQLSSVIAVGGRYDELISSFDLLNQKNDKKFEPKGAVGLSIEFEKLMKYVLDEEIKCQTTFGQIIDVVVCSLTKQNMDCVLKELCSITKEFWNNGIKVFCFPEDIPKNIEELHSFCMENSVRFAVVLKDSADSNQSNFNPLTAKLFAYEKERYLDKKGGNIADVVEYVIRAVASVKSESNNIYINLSSDQSITRSDSNKMLGSQSQFSGDQNYSQYSTVGSNIRVTFVCNERLHGIPKKRTESSIISHLSNALNFVTNNTIIEAIAVDLPFNVLKTMAAEIELDNENEPKSHLDKCKLSIMDRHLRHRKHISEIVDTIFELKFDKKCQILCIISINDNMKFKILN